MSRTQTSKQMSRSRMRTWAPMALAVSAAMALPSAVAQAGPKKPRPSSEELTRYLSQEIETISGAVSGCDPDCPGEQEEAAAAFERDESWFLRRFRLRLRPKVSFSLQVAKIEVIPELELLWERTTPEGWAVYRPLK